MMEKELELEQDPPREVRVSGVELRVVDDTLDVKRDPEKELELRSEALQMHCCVQFYRGGDIVYELKVHSMKDIYTAASNVLMLKVPEGSAVAIFASDRDAGEVLDHFSSRLPDSVQRRVSKDVFSLRTEEASAKQYFQFYGYLSQQQNMMQDYVRTSTYQTAILHNLNDFKDKVVLDVGAGTGVLSFFALQGGARKVYSVEASNMSKHCSQLAKANKFEDRMAVIAAKIEEIDLPEKVDVIISEPMGYMLFNERMLETYLHARKWLKPGGKMFPTQGILYVAPFTDEALFLEQMGKTYFWQQRSFHGVDVSVLHSEAVEEYFRQPIVDTFDIRILMSRPIGHTTDFSTAHEKDLHKISIPLSFKSWTTGYMHGLAFWFDVAFIGTQTTVWLSTAPFQPLTHWYQVRLLLQRPLYVQEGQEVGGMLQMVANERQSYDISVSVMVVGTNQQSSGTYDLKNPNFRYMTSPQAPPGSFHTNPTESYFDGQTIGVEQSHDQRMAALQLHPQVMRSSVAQEYPVNPHTMGALQTGTEVIPVVNGSIISPSVQQQSPSGLQPDLALQTAPHSQLGMGTGGIIDLGTGTGHPGTGTLQYQMGVSHHSGGNVVYQKWLSHPPHGSFMQTQRHKGCGGRGGLSPPTFRTGGAEPPQNWRVSMGQMY